MRVCYLFTIYLSCLTSLIYAEEYKDPQPQLFELDLAKINLDKNECVELADQIAKTCSYFDNRNDTTLDYCYKALSLALLLDETNKTAIVSNSLLSRGAKLIVDQKDQTSLFVEIQKTLKELSNNPSPEDVKLMGYLYSLCMKTDSENTDLIYEQALFEKKHGQTSWLKFDSKNTPLLDEDGKRILSKDRLKKSQIKGLLVIRLNNGKYVGSVSQMSTIATTRKERAWLSTGFNQKVGGIMQSSREEVAKLLHHRYQTSKAYSHLEFSFADKHSGKDGPSAALAMALMAESILTGRELDQNIAVTGDITAVGEIQPVGAIASKVKAAIKSKCTHVGIPIGNLKAIEDHCLINGLSMLYEIQIFTLENIEQADQISYQQKSTGIAQVMEQFQSIMAILKKDPSYIYNAKVKEKLVAINELVPYHFSAKLLLKHTNKAASKKLSTGGSFSALDRFHADIFARVRNRGLRAPQLKDDASSLRKLPSIMAPKVKSYHYAIVDLLNITIDYKTSTDSQGARHWKKMRPAMDRVNKERKKLMEDPDIVADILE